MVQVLIVSELCSTIKDFPAGITMAQLCDKLYPITGILPQDMRLIFETEGKEQNMVTDAVKKPHMTPILQYKTLERIVVEDTNSESIATQLAHSQNVDAYQLPESEYVKREDTVLNWKKQNQLGRFNPEHQKKVESDRKLGQEYLKKLEINQRCRVKSAGQPERRGWLRYIGLIPEINPNDIWCGIEFDEPTGRNNGSCKNHSYFGPVLPNYGGFIKPTNVETSPLYTPFTIDIDSADETDDEV